MGRRIRELRKERHLTQSQLAEKADLTQVSIGYYERGVKFPSAGTIERLARALGARPEDLFKEQPTDSLDYERREAFKDLVNILREDPPEYIRTVGEFFREIRKRSK
ncbi:MAG: helix-turn-helix transcriptional regulator [Deltaproteobacteria bacterium]|nr:helix-turn-helix transcriptional regulator [Deltaproteobacteria bacterium]